MPDCTLTTLSKTSACLNCLSLTEKQALRTWFLAQAVKGLGGPDLTAVSTLFQTVSCLTCEPDFVLDSMSVLLTQRIALNAGAAVNLPINQLRQKINCSPCGEPKLRRAGELYLRCQLNAFIGTGAN